MEKLKKEKKLKSGVNVNGKGFRQEKEQKKEKPVKQGHQAKKQVQQIIKKQEQQREKQGQQTKKQVQQREKQRQQIEKQGKAECPYMKICGGCQYLHLSYEKQCTVKQKRVKALLGKYGTVEPMVKMENPYYYRNKVHAVVDRDRKGNPITGVYQMGTHRVVSVEHCRIENQKADAIIRTIRGLLKSFKIKIYDEDSQYGLVRHILVRCGIQTGQVMVVLVTASPVFPSKNHFVKALREAHPEITTVVQNINPRGTSMVLGTREQVLFGKGYIEDRLCGKKFRISARSFYQVNSVQTEKLYRLAIDFAQLTGKETVIDAYCGIGTIGMIAAERAKRVIGVELNEDAVKDARRNAKENQEKKAVFYQGDAGVFMREMAAAGETADVVFLDPPRSGSTEEFIEAVKEIAPRRVVYISCNPETLARDLACFQKKGYRMERAVPVDMFPWTEEIETVCILSKLKSTQHIEVERFDKCGE